MTLLDTTDCVIEDIEDTRCGVDLYRDEDDELIPITLPGHNRYLIYKMLGRFVSFEHAGRKKKKVQNGLVTGVSRNIFTHEVELTMKGGRVFRFKEPTAIVAPIIKEIVFVYGSLVQSDTSDKAFFASMSRYDGRTMDDFIRDSSPVIYRFQKFSLGDKAPVTGRFSRCRKN